MAEPTSSNNVNSFMIYGIEFPSKGILENYDGFLHVKVDMRMRDLIFEALRNDPTQVAPALKDRVRVPSFRHSREEVGAYVTVLDFGERNAATKNVCKFIADNPKTEIVFDRVIGISRLNDTAVAEHLWVLELESKQLESVRRDELGLKPTPNYGRTNFYVSIGEVPRSPQVLRGFGRRSIDK